jgi:ATP-dependent exoDNAse (exonuclease V) alpha subunit
MVQSPGALLSSTHIVGLRQIADDINSLISRCLPFNDRCSDPLASLAIDMLNFEMIDNESDNHLSFKNHTNLPKSVTLQEGSRVMFLNNILFEHSICNGSIGVITKVVDDENIEVTFPTTDNLLKINVQKVTARFDINGSPATRRQFPLQNAFALTVHKTQGLTLSHTTVTVDENMFAPGQIYVAMSRAPSWNSITVTSFDFNSLKVDDDVIKEYRRLNDLVQRI